MKRKDLIKELEKMGCTDPPGTSARGIEWTRNRTSSSRKPKGPLPVCQKHSI